MLFTKKLRPPEGGQSTPPGTSNRGIAQGVLGRQAANGGLADAQSARLITSATPPRNDRYIENRESDIRRIYEHISYMQETLEIKFSEFERKLAESEKALKSLQEQKTE